MFRKNIKIKIVSHFNTFLFVLILFFTCTKTKAQIEYLRFNNITVEDGISQMTINGITQDKYGFLWIATQDGLNRYDGYNFKIFKHSSSDKNSISDSYILSLFKDSKNQLWIGTEIGLNYYDQQKEKFIHYKHKNNSSQNSVNVIYEAASIPGTLWLGTNKGLIKFNTQTKLFTGCNLNLSNSETPQNLLVNNIYEAPSQPGILWIGTNTGLFKYNIHQNYFKHFIHKKGHNSLSNNYVNVIFEDSYKNLWIGTTNGLNLYNRKTNQYTVYYHKPGNHKSIGQNNVRIIFEDSNKNLWFGLWGGGLNLYLREKNEFQGWINDPGNPFSISGNYVTNIFEDKSGIIWIGTQVGGLNKINPNAKKIIHLFHNPNNKNSLSHNSVRSIIKDQNGLLWVGTDNGLTTINRKTGEYKHFFHNPKNKNSLSNNQLRSVFQSKDGTFWFGTKFGGLNKYNANKHKFTHYSQEIYNPNSLNSNYIRAINEDKHGNIWIGTVDGGLSKFNPKTEKFINYLYQPNNNNSINNNRVYSIQIDKNGIIWLGTGFGLAKFNPQKEQFTRYKSQPGNPQGLSHHLVMGLTIDSKELIWIATYGGGLNKFNPKTGIFKRYTTEDGLPNNAIYGIIEDNNHNLWLSTNRGISEFNTETEKFINYEIKDGLQNSEFNSGAYYKDEKGNIYFGGISGLNIILPDNIKHKATPPPVVIHNFQVFNKKVLISDTTNHNAILKTTILETNNIELSYQQNVFSFSFSVLDFTFPEKNKYAYKLENFDTKWTYAKDRQYANYTSLPPGKYIFKVKGANSNGIWNKKAKEIHITIHPPYWETWWFRILSILFIIFLIYLWIKNKTQTIEKQKKILEEKVKSRTEQLYEANISLEEKQGDLETKQEKIMAQSNAIRKQNKELKQHRNNLDKLVKERTTELEKAKIKAEESDKLKSAFLANMSHEIRTPMNAIIGFSDLIIEPDINQEQKNDLSNRISQNCDSLLRLIDDIIDLAKIEAGQLLIKKEEFNTFELIEELYTIYTYKKDILNKNNINLKINNHSTDKTIVVFSDKIRIKQVLINLLDNAFKFTNEGNIKFGYTIQNSMVKFFVKDTGIGLTKEQTTEIFNRFSKIENPKNKNLYRGAGLGLAISKNIVELLDGKIWAESTPGNGSKFSFTIPVN